jgi:hypothetical protein
VTLSHTVALFSAEESRRAKYGKPDAHLYDVCYILDKTLQPKR